MKTEINNILRTVWMDTAGSTMMFLKGQIGSYKIQNIKRILT
jgi:hypothetical protein